MITLIQALNFLQIDSDLGKRLYTVAVVIVQPLTDIQIGLIYKTKGV